MKNITLTVDEETLKAARIYAAEHDTTVSALVRQYLADLARTKSESGAAERARIGEELVALSERSPGRLGDWKWNREDIYRERLSRYEHPGLRRHGQRARGGKEGTGE
jgi:hypothetical protein